MTDVDLFSRNTIGPIQSAFINTNTAKSICIDAREAIGDGDWPEAVRHLSEAIAQLESAKSKLEAQL